MGKEYKIIKDPTIEECGFLLEDAGTITINTSYPDDEILNTLVHELGHALFRRCGFNQGIQDQLEEAIVQSYANMITEIFTLKLKPKKKNQED